MPTGVSNLYRPDRQPTLQDIHTENSYFLVTLHAIQAYFAAGWLTRPGFLTISSSVESSYQPDQTVHSLHQITTLKKNVPCNIGLRTNLTDWLPAHAIGSIRIVLNLTVTQDTPFKDLVNQMEQIDLVSKISLVRPDWGAAVKVSEITGRLLSYFLQEGNTKSVFDLIMDLNIQEVKSGYYAVFGSPENIRWPTELWMDSQDRLTGETYILDKLCFAVIKILALPRRGEEIARNEPWWELLQTAKDQVIDSYPIDDVERLKILNDWRNTLRQVRKLSRKEKSFLLTEIQEIILMAQAEVTQKMQQKTVEAALEFPEDLQDALGVATEEALFNSVRDYQDALEVSKRLLQQYT